MSIDHPHPFPTFTHHFQAFLMNFFHCPKMVQEGYIMLQDAKINRGFFYYHIMKIMHPFAELFHGVMHIDDGNMLKQLQQILVHTF